MRNLYLVVGGSGGGKDTIADIVCTRHGYSKVVFHTTRARRTRTRTSS